MIFFSFSTLYIFSWRLICFNQFQFTPNKIRRKILCINWGSFNWECMEGAHNLTRDSCHLIISPFDFQADLINWFVLFSIVLLQFFVLGCVRYFKCQTSQGKTCTYYECSWTCCLRGYGSTLGNQQNSRLMTPSQCQWVSLLTD